MYIPAHFRIDPSTSKLLDIVKRTNLATLVTAGHHQPPQHDNEQPAPPKIALHATHLPMMLRVLPDDANQNQTIQLIGHIAKGNPQWKQLDFSSPDSYQALAIFTPPTDTYVSPSYYPSKKETGKVVPTWNYQSVHASGRLEIITERDALLSIVSDLSILHESKIGSQWRVSDAPEAYIETMLKAIVGVVLHVEKIEGVSKMSQNKTGEDFDGVVAGLEKRSARAETAEDDMAGAAAGIMREWKTEKEKEKAAVGST